MGPENLFFPQKAGSHQLQSQGWIFQFCDALEISNCDSGPNDLSQKVVDRLEDAILEGYDVGEYLKSSIEAQHLLMSVGMAMIWEFVFASYLFRLDHKRRQELESLKSRLAASGKDFSTSRCQLQIEGDMLKIKRYTIHARPLASSHTDDLLQTPEIC